MTSLVIIIHSFLFCNLNIKLTFNLNIKSSLSSFLLDFTIFVFLEFILILNFSFINKYTASSISDLFLKNNIISKSLIFYFFSLSTSNFYFFPIPFPYKLKINGEKFFVSLLSGSEFLFLHLLLYYIFNLASKLTSVNPKFNMLIFLSLYCEFEIYKLKIFSMSEYTSIKYIVTKEEKTEFKCFWNYQFGIISIISYLYSGL